MIVSLTEDCLQLMSNHFDCDAKDFYWNNFLLMRLITSFSFADSTNKTLIARQSMSPARMNKQQEIYSCRDKLLLLNLWKNIGM